MFKFKKGTEKPIEIFVALFIILAVAMVMLKMFKGQIQEKSAEMKELESANDIEQALETARIKCMQKCTDTYKQDCSLTTKMQFCTQTVGPLDLDGDRTTNGLDSNLMGGIAVCEDGLYCPMIYECNCGEELNLLNCRNITCQYLTAQGISTAGDRTSALSNTFYNGTCDLSSAGTLGWYRLNGFMNGCPTDT